MRQPQATSATSTTSAAAAATSSSSGMTTRTRPPAPETVAFTHYGECYHKVSRETIRASNV
eukprot:4502783-Prorocentrum_lima.AAC.1